MDNAKILIPFNRASMVGAELTYIAQAVANGHVSGDGPFTRKCSNLLMSATDVRSALLTTSCTHALEMCALLLNLEPGDEVILPSFTFVSTANAFALRGARLIFADIRADTLNIDEGKLPSLITSRTKAIAVVHYAGVGCQMDAIMAIARQHGLRVIEDNAHGLFGYYNGKPLGSFGDLSTLSFHETKNFSCGEGGALLINDTSLIERAEIIREKGTNRSQFFRGQTDKYTWVDLGSSYLPSDMLAGFLLGQLEKREEVQARRRYLWDRYSSDLEAWSRQNDSRLPYIPDNCEHAAHLFYLILPSLEARQELIAHLRSCGILSVFHYVPLHSSPMGKESGTAPIGCPVTEQISERLVRLPLYYSLTDEEQSLVIEAVRKFSCERKPR